MCIFVPEVQGSSAAFVGSMQTSKALTRALATLQSKANPVSHLTELTKWHAESVTGSLSRQSALACGQYRPYASASTATEKERVVILGTGWAAARLTRDLNCNYHDITVSCADSRGQAPASIAVGVSKHTTTCFVIGRSCHHEIIWCSPPC